MFLERFVLWCFREMEIDSNIVELAVMFLHTFLVSE